jgi:hypothetical protein
MDGQSFDQILPTEKDLMVFPMETGIQISATNHHCTIFNLDSHTAIKFVGDSTYSVWNQWYVGQLKRQPN